MMGRTRNQRGPHNRKRNRYNPNAPSWAKVHAPGGAFSGFFLPMLMTTDGRTLAKPRSQ